MGKVPLTVIRAGQSLPIELPVSASPRDTGFQR